MMRSMYTLALSVGLVLSAGSLLAQGERRTNESDSALRSQRTDRVTKIGGAAYWAYGTHDATFKTLPPFTNCCDENGATTGNTYGVALRIRDIAPSLSFPLSVHAGYRNSAARFRTTTTERMFDGTPTTVNALIEHAVDLTWHDVTFGVTADIALYQPVWLTLGIEGTYTAGASYTQSERLVTPTTMVFETGTNERNLSSGSLSGYSPVNALADLGLRIRLLNFDVTKDDPLGTWIDLRGRYLWQITPTYNDPATEDNVGRAYRRHLLTVGLEAYF